MISRQNSDQYLVVDELMLLYKDFNAIPINSDKTNLKSFL